jgi:hypothetical protein
LSFCHVVTPFVAAADGSLCLLHADVRHLTSEDVDHMVSTKLVQLTAQVEKHEQDGSASKSELSVLKKSLDALSAAISTSKGDYAATRGEFLELRSSLERLTEQAGERRSSEGYVTREELDALRVLLEKHVDSSVSLYSRRCKDWSPFYFKRFSELFVFWIAKSLSSFEKCYFVSIFLSSLLPFLS